MTDGQNEVAVNESGTNGMPTLKRRTVATITNFVQPKELFQLVTGKTRNYQMLSDTYICRDRALMAGCFLTGGRISPIVGDYKYKTVNGKTVKVGKYDGMCRSNLTITDDYILFRNLEVGKRTERMLKKYGEQVGRRDDFIAPLKPGLHTNKYYDQFIPFSWLLLDYVKNYAPAHEELFPMSRNWAWTLISEITGQFPHWFRAQCEDFFANYIFKDSVLLAKFMKVDPKQTARYIRFDWRAGLTEQMQPMDFDWIQVETEKLKQRVLRA